MRIFKKKKKEKETKKEGKVKKRGSRTKPFQISFPYIHFYERKREKEIKKTQN